MKHLIASIREYFNKLMVQKMESKVSACEEEYPIQVDPCDAEPPKAYTDTFTKKEVSYILEGLKSINAQKRKAYKEMKSTGLDKKYLRALGRDIYNIQLLIDRIKETCLSNSEQ